MAAVWADCAAVWGRAPIVSADCAAVWRGAPLVAADCAAVWDAGVPVFADCAAVWAHQTPVFADCAAVWRHAAGPVSADCAAVWEYVDNPEPPPIDPPPYQPDDIRVILPGRRAGDIDPIRISLTWSREQSAIEAELELADEQYHLMARHTAVTIEIWGYRFELVIDGRARSESFGRSAWTIRLASPAVTLDSPWADGVEGELTGQAKTLAATLAGAIPLTWSAVDWRIGPGRWIANGESPLALLQTLASAVGAVLGSRPDGGLVVAPLYPVSPPDWTATEPAAYYTAAGEVITLATGEERKDGINAVTVSDAGATTQTLRLEEDTDKKNGGMTEVLVYQTPWLDNFILTHRGNPATAGIETLGLEEPVIADEEIIVQDGKGQAQYPVHAIVSARWNWRNLGTPTFAESGEITVEPNDESILLLTYRTKRRRYRAREVNRTDLLVVAEDEA